MAIDLSRLEPEYSFVRIGADGKLEHAKEDSEGAFWVENLSPLIANKGLALTLVVNVGEDGTLSTPTIRRFDI